MVVAPVDGLLAEVAQGVVHQPHVPLVVEAQPALGGRTADPGERGALLGDHHRPGVVMVHEVVHAAQEIDRLEVFTATVAVRHPLALGP